MYIQEAVLPSLRNHHDEHLLKQLKQRWDNHKVHRPALTPPPPSFRVPCCRGSRRSLRSGALWLQGRQPCTSGRSGVWGSRRQQSLGRSSGCRPRVEAAARFQEPCSNLLPSNLFLKDWAYCMNAALGQSGEPSTPGRSIRTSPTLRTLPADHGALAVPILQLPRPLLHPASQPAPAQRRGAASVQG